MAACSMYLRIYLSVARDSVNCRVLLSPGRNMEVDCVCKKMEEHILTTSKGIIIKTIPQLTLNNLM